jgi:hypothetical protein
MLLDRFNEFIAVSRPLSEERQDDKLEIIRVEPASSRKLAIASAAHEAMPPVMGTVPTTAALIGPNPFVIVKHILKYILRYIRCKKKIADGNTVSTS